MRTEFRNRIQHKKIAHFSTKNKYSGQLKETFIATIAVNCLKKFEETF